MTEVLYRSDWILPEAPVQHQKGRVCMRGIKCRGVEHTGHANILSIYTTPVTKGTHPVWLCSACKVDLSDSGMSARAFVGVKKQRVVSYKLPKLRAIRKELGVTGDELAEKINCDVSTLYAIERGRKSSTVLAGRIARYLDVSINKLRGLR